MGRNIHFTINLFFLEIGCRYYMRANLKNIAYHSYEMPERNAVRVGDSPFCLFLSDLD